MATRGEVILADTSAWVLLLRGEDHPVRWALRDRVVRGEEVVLTEVVLMELIAGARSESEAEDLRERLLSFPLLRLRGLGDFEEAAALYRRCRQAGETLRGLDDCLIAVPAIRAGARVLHDDGDFRTIARNSDLQLEEP